MPSPHVKTLLKYHPHLHTPIVVGAPTRPFALHRVAVVVSQAGGLGFISSTPFDRTELASASSFFSAHPLPTRSLSTEPDSRPLLPIGIGYLCWMTSLETAISDLTAYPVQAIWLYAWTDLTQLKQWVSALRSNFPATIIYIQICSVQSTFEVLGAVANPDVLEHLVLIVQGSDAGGHGATRAASLITLLPEVRAALRSYGKGYDAIPVLGAGGVMEADSAAATITLGADGVVLGTRLLASEEMTNAIAFKKHIVEASDGGVGTVRTRLFDSMRGTADFPAYYDGRALINRSVKEESEGVSEEELVKRYKEAENRHRAKADGTGTGDSDDETYGINGRLTSYSGTGVGLVTGIQPAGDIVREVREGIVEKVRELAAEMA